MQALPFKKMDAFTGPQSSGNPAGAIYLEAPGQLSPMQMQKIAFECKGWVSEVGFVAGEGHNKFWMRYYSSEREVEFCGHATLAIVYDLITSNLSLRSQPEIQVHTRDSELRAFNRVAVEDAVYISAPKPGYSECRVQPEACSRALGMGTAKGVQPKAVINAGLETMIVEVESLSAILSLAPDTDELKTFCIKHEVDIILAFTNEVSTKGCAYRTRVFAPRFGYLEDPATGSGNSAFGYYLIRSNTWNDGVLVVEQNGSVQNPNFVRLALGRDDEGHPRVRFGGRATVRIKGEYFV